MRLTIFSRVMLAQSILIALVLTVSLYALTTLHSLTRLNTDILAVDSTCIDEGKRLIKSFLSEMRNAEKYLLLHDPAFYDGFTNARRDFEEALGRIAALVSTDRERELTSEIEHLHARYAHEIRLAISGKNFAEQNKSRTSERIIESANELIQLRERVMADKTVAARDLAAFAAYVMFWFTAVGIVGALILALLHARGLSHPLQKLSREMRHVGRGEFTRSLDFRGPKEVQQLASAFNLMAEELAHLDQLKSDFTAHVSHELRTPLTAIREGTALLLEAIPGPLTHDQREILNVVRNHSERLFRSISSILDLSKMEAEMMEYELTLCDLGTIIRWSVQNVELIARKRGIHLRMEFPDSIPMLVMDERRIQQVLDNLLSNALKFTPEGGEITVNASLRKTRNEQGHEEVQISITDTGQGIPQEEIRHVFKQFYQGAHNREKGRQGTGLGLAIARHIVEAHRGSIWAESKTSQGCTFHFTLPVTPAMEDLSHRLSDSDNSEASMS